MLSSLCYFHPIKMSLEFANRISSLGKLALSFAPRAARRRITSAKVVSHVGAVGLFFMAALDSSPIPTFGGPDILIAILSARHAEPWYYYATVATLGSIAGAYLTYRAARTAGSDYLRKKFGKRRVSKFLAFFEKWGTGGLAFSSAVPFPFPTSALFAAAGVLNYPLRKFMVVVTICRGVRYAAIVMIRRMLAGGEQSAEAQ
jgi:membrane protein YqaA with SNARE-associated domain